LGALPEVLFRVCLVVRTKPGSRSGSMEVAHPTRRRSGDPLEAHGSPQLPFSRDRSHECRSTKRHVFDVHLRLREPLLSIYVILNPCFPQRTPLNIRQKGPGYMDGSLRNGAGIVPFCYAHALQRREFRMLSFVFIGKCRRGGRGGDFAVCRQLFATPEGTTRSRDGLCGSWRGLGQRWLRRAEAVASK